MDIEKLKLCAQINQSCKQILENPRFWLKTFRGLSKENMREWIKAIKQVNNSAKQNAIISYLQWNLNKEAVDLPCYTSPAIQDDFRKRIMESCAVFRNDRFLMNKIFLITTAGRGSDKFLVT